MHVACRPEPRTAIDEDEDDQYGVSDISLDKKSKLCQPKLSKFPKTQGRKFNSTHYDDFSWIEYSVKKDSVFCFACRHFSTEAARKGETEGRRVFVNVGYKQWKDAKANFKKHDISDRHKLSIILWSNFQNVEADSSKSIEASIKNMSKSEIMSNREQVKIIFEVVSVCARQDLAFRGHDEHDARNKGNFIEILNSMVKNVEPNIRLMFDRRYGHYTSHGLQNEFISILGQAVQNDIAKNAQKATYFAVVADETKDVSRKEQLAIMVRYYDAHAQTIFERAIGCYHLKSLTADALSQYIFQEVKNLGLD